MSTLANISLFSACMLMIFGQSQAAVETRSPDGKLAIAVDYASTGTLSYSLQVDGKLVIADALMGLDFGKNGVLPRQGWKLAGSTSRKEDAVWKPVWGKRAVVPDVYQESSIDLTGDGPFKAMRVIVRTYNDGVAFRYLIPQDATGSPLRAESELTQFAFTGDFTSWFYNGEKHNLGPDPLSSIQGTRSPVMLVKAAGDCWLAVHEADLRAGAPMQLAKSGPTAFKVPGSPGEIKPGYTGPWRVVFAGRHPGTLVDSHLLELLNPPPQGDFSWVKPGVDVWDWRIDGAVADGFQYSMSLPSWKRMVDFAEKNHIRHLVLDANWYGAEFAKESDPTTGGKAADVREIIRYGKAKGVGVWLYLNDVGGRKYPLEDTLRQYSEWGASGVKYGFMTGGAEEKNARTRTITELCAKYKLLCDFHDGPVHPYGQMRTWPNAVTREFCWAQLDGKKPGFEPKTFVTSVFVNMLAGPLDMNNGMFDLRQGPSTRVDNNRVPNSTVVSEAARTLIVFSGATILPDIPEFYQKYPELLEFIGSQKMPWRESRTLTGEVGRVIVMARQAADGVWLVGAATNEEARELDVKLDFLESGAYEAEIIEDGDDAHYQTNRESWKHHKDKVTQTGALHLKLAPGGGACVILRPAGH